MSSLFQIVFSGELLDGFELTTVKASAARRLKAAPEQVDRIFSGKRAVLKKGLSDEIAQRYFAELQRIGMRVKLEPEAGTSPAAATVDPIGAIDPLLGAPKPVVKNEPQRVTSRDEPVFDPMKTQISSMRDDSPPSPERWSQPTIAISQRHLNATLSAAGADAADSSHEPTLIVPPRNRASEPTIVVTRGGSASNTSGTSANSPVNVSSSHAPAMVVPPRHSAASEPTMIVPPKHSDSSAPTMIVPPRASSAASEPTLIVPPRHSAASEPTLIVPPRNSAASEPTMIVPPKHDDASSAVTMIVPPRQSGASQPVIVRSNQKLPPNVKTAEADQPFDPERTLLSNLDSVADYQSPVSEAELARAAPSAPRDPGGDSGIEVQCPTCGDKQPKRVYCRRCGHALTLPPKTVMGESTITKKPFNRPPTPAAPSSPAASQETVLVEEHEEPRTKSAAKKGFLAAPTWFIIILLFLLLLGLAGWLIFG